MRMKKKWLDVSWHDVPNLPHSWLNRLPIVAIVRKFSGETSTIKGQ